MLTASWKTFRWSHHLQRSKRRFFQCFAFADWEAAPTAIPIPPPTIPLAPRLPASGQRYAWTTFSFTGSSVFPGDFSHHSIEVNPHSNGLCIRWFGNQIIWIKSQHCSDVNGFLSDRKVSAYRDFPLSLTEQFLSPCDGFLPSYEHL